MQALLGLQQKQKRPYMQLQHFDQFASQPKGLSATEKGFERHLVAQR